MGDCGHELTFGTFLTPDAAHADRVVALAQLTEAAGLDLVTIQDHPYQARFLDAWTLLSVLAGKTSRVRLSPNVANLPLRPPAVLAKSVASLDILSGGRAALGLGAGGFWDAIGAYGGRKLAPGEAVAALEEAIGVIRGIWGAQGRSVRVEGAHYRISGAHAGPAPAHEVPIWLGAIKPRMLRLTGRLADGWLPSSAYVPPEQLPASNAIIDEAAAAAGRQPGDVRRLYNLMGSFDGAGDGFLNGPPRLWAEQLAELTLDQGVSIYILASDDPRDIERFAGEVAPAVRELVAAGRSGTAPGGGTGTGGPRGTGTPAADGPAGGTETDGADEPETGRPSVTGGGVPARPARRSAPSAGPLAVQPTPDDGNRLSDVQPWDESSRPSGPAPDPDRSYTPHEQASGRHLVDVHDHLRAELREVRSIVDQVLDGTMGPGAARGHLNTMTMRQNSWTLGAYCATYCRTVTVHHTLEDSGMFPHLRRADGRLTPVIDRLEAEHRVIHDVIEDVDRALISFVSEPDGGKKLEQAVNLLTDTLLSHLAYEERELVEPLARFGYGG